MQKIPSSAIMIALLFKDSPRIVTKPNVHYRAQRGPPLGPTLKLTNPLYQGAQTGPQLGPILNLINPVHTLHPTSLKYISLSLNRL
jgi:hypothetical protein